MVRNVVTFAAAVLFAGMPLTACNNDAAQEASAQENQAAAARAKAPIDLPSITASRAYRCADNTLVYVDFFTDNTAAIRTEELGTPTKLTPEDGQPPFKAAGFTVAANEATTSITLPGKSAQTCRARG